MPLSLSELFLLFTFLLAAVKVAQAKEAILMKNYITQGLSAGARWTTQITARVSLTTAKVCAD
jgi:hypothetical protein